MKTNRLEKRVPERDVGQLCEDHWLRVKGQVLVFERHGGKEWRGGEPMPLIQTSLEKSVKDEF